LVNELAHINSPALLLSQQGECLEHNVLFSSNTELLAHKEQIIAHLQPFLSLSHKTTAYYTQSCRISLSLIALDEGKRLVCCHCIPRPITTTPATSSIQHDHNYYALLDVDLEILSSNHPQLVKSGSAKKQFEQLFSAKNIAKIKGSVSQLSSSQRIELSLKHKEQSIFLSIESIGLSEQQYWLIIWHPIDAGSNKNSGFLQKYSYLLNAVNQLSEGLIIIDRYNKVELCNQQLYRIFPYLENQPVIGMTALEAINIVLANEFKSDHRKIVAITRWYKNKINDKSLVNFSFTSQSGLTLEYRDRFTAEGERICLLLDETNITQLHEKIEKTWLKSVEVSAAKSQFMAAMGHEIRTPLNAIIGLLELTLRDSRYQDNKHLQVASRSANHLLNLLNDVLDYTKFDADKVNLSAVDADLRLLCEDVVATFAVQAQQRGIWLELFVDPKLEKLLHYDDVRITQILHNLLSNAIKFNTSEHPSILIKLEAMSSTATSQTIKFAVCDNGIGLTPEQQKKIFQGFVQADDDTYRKFGGTGLGLSICQKICLLMQSELRVDSEVNHGATFYFIVKIPFTNTKKVQITQQNPLYALSRSDLSIYTNHPKLSYTLQRYADSLGFNLHYVSSYSLLELDDPSAVILFDPNQADLKFCNSLLNDKTLFEYLQAMPQRKALLIQDGDMSANQTSINQMSLMPLRLEQLLYLVNDKNGEPSKKLQGPEVVKDFHRIHALVVEDNADNIFVLEHQLASIGVKATFCEDPEKAIIEFQQHNFNLIISDYQMPNLTGAELTQTIRYIEETEFRLPTQIIVLTADKSESCQNACNKAGVNQVLIKPLSLPVLQKYLCDLNIVLKESEDDPNQEGELFDLGGDYDDRDDIFIDIFNNDEENVDLNTHIDDEPQASDVAPMDINEIYKYVGEITDEELDDFLVQFTKNLIKRHQGIAQAIGAQDFKNVHALAHTIKSSALYIGAQALSDACQQLESAAKKSNLDESFINQLWQVTEREIERLLAYLAARKTANGEK
jgi:two-component system sensor histidine kinase BarA